MMFLIACLAWFEESLCTLSFSSFVFVCGYGCVEKAICRVLLFQRLPVSAVGLQKQRQTNVQDCQLEQGVERERTWQTNNRENNSDHQYHSEQKNN
eukprot:2738160-Amphidinium_carterae.1